MQLAIYAHFWARYCRCGKRCHGESETGNNCLRLARRLHQLYCIGLFLRNVKFHDSNQGLDDGTWEHEQTAARSTRSGKGPRLIINGTVVSPCTRGLVEGLSKPRYLVCMAESGNLIGSASFLGLWLSDILYDSLTPYYGDEEMRITFGRSSNSADIISMANRAATLTQPAKPSHGFGTSLSRKGSISRLTAARKPWSLGPCTNLPPGTWRERDSWKGAWRSRRVFLVFRFNNTRSSQPSSSSL